MKTVLAKKASHSLDKDTKKQIFSSWGREAYINPAPKKAIDIFKTQRMPQHTN